MRGLLDTSILIGIETDRPVAELPDESAISIITLEELAVGVLLAEQRGESEVATRRKATLATVGATFEALPVTQSVAMACAQIRASGRAAWCAVRTLRCAHRGNRRGCELTALYPGRFALTTARGRRAARLNGARSDRGAGQRPADRA